MLGVPKKSQIFLTWHWWSFLNLQRTWPTQPLALGSRFRVLGLPTAGACAPPVPRQVIRFK